MSVTVTKLADGWRHEQTTVKNCTRVYWVEATSAEDLQNEVPSRGAIPSYTDWPSGYRVDTASLEGVGNGNTAPYIGKLTINGATKLPGAGFINNTTKVGYYSGSVQRSSYSVLPRHLGCLRMSSGRMLRKTDADSQEEGVCLRWDGVQLAEVGEWVYKGANLTSAGEPDLTTCQLTNGSGTSTPLTPPDCDKELTTLTYSLNVYKAKTDPLAASDFMDKAITGWGTSNKYFPPIEEESGLTGDGKWRTVGFSVQSDADFDGDEILLYTIVMESIPYALGSGTYWNPDLYDGLNLNTLD